MTTTASIKRQNLRAITAYIYEHEHATKRDLERDLKLSLPTISQNLATLTKLGFVESPTTLDSTGGRRARAYEFNAGARCAIGIEMGSESTLCCAVDLRGAVMARRRIDARFEVSHSRIERIGAGIAAFARDLEHAGHLVLGVAFAINGLISQDGSNVTFGRLMNNTGLRLSTLEDAVGWPCTLVHDSIAAASAELWFDRSISDAVCLYLKKRPGGAVIMDGRISLGPNMRNGTVEHMTLVPGGRKCYCGRRGCADPYCSSDFLLEGFMDYNNDNAADPDNLQRFFERMHSNDRAANERFSTWLDYVAGVVNNVRSVLACDVIIGGETGALMNDGDLAELKVRADTLNSFPDDRYSIRRSICAPDQEIVGAALRYITPFVADLCG